MQPSTLPRRPALRADGLVLGLLRTDDAALGAALLTLAATPELLEGTTRVVVLDRGATPAARVPEAALLPPGLLHVVRRPGADRAAALAAILHAATAEAEAGAVLLLDDAAVRDPDVLLAAARAGRRSPSSDVVGLTSSLATRPAPATWWGALLPLDAVRAVGYTVPEAGDLALAELALRAEAAGFRPVVVRAAGPLPDASAADGLLLALLHAPVRARTRLLAADLAAELRALLALRPASVADRHRALRALLRGPGAPAAPSRARPAGLPADAIRLHVRLWLAWPDLRKAYRRGALERASAEAWDLRAAPAETAGGTTRGGRWTAIGRPAGIRLRPWSTARRGTSAA